MQHLWSADELIANWSLAPGDMTVLAGLSGAGRLGKRQWISLCTRFRVANTTELIRVSM